MKLLLLSDRESPYLWDYYQPGRLASYDLILSCGDLNAHYLSFLVTMGRVPLLYVHGNHDGSYQYHPPEGCECIEDRVYVYKGLRILGLGGCAQYNGGKHQYSEKEMRRRVRKLWREIKKAGGVDIVLTHTPPAGCGDGEDYAHRGFECFLDLMDRYSPKYLIHGHVHMNYSTEIVRELKYKETKIINAYERYELVIGDKPP